jgi:pre-mRNA branch site protein p14
MFRQIRLGIANNSKGTAFVVYEDVMDAKTACDKLNGFNFQNRYLVGSFVLSVPFKLFEICLLIGIDGG